jgi:hypothetical protein
VVNRAAFLLGALAAMAPAHADRQYVGVALDRDDGRVLYEEHHYLRGPEDAPRQRLVLYRCAGGAPFARKQVEYGAARAAPAFILEDARFGYREGATREGATLVAFHRADAEQRERRAAVAAGEALVVDAGFDEFVRAQWPRLRRGETVALDFLLPSRLQTLRFKLRRVGTDTIAGAPASVYRLALGGLLGWFAPDIEVTYRDADRRLLRFEGPTNIRADRDDNLVARIEFDPAADRLPPAAASWDAALAEPLRACKPGA